VSDPHPAVVASSRVGAGLIEEVVDVTGELGVVLEEKAVS
jgi:hypothetical protein